VKQPRVARLESGEHNPTWDTLWLLASRLGLSFFLGIAPFTGEPDARRPIWRCPDVAEFVKEAAVEDVASTRSGTQTFVVAKLIESDRKAGVNEQG
jgi:hypothetical protein